MGNSRSAPVREDWVQMDPVPESNNLGPTPVSNPSALNPSAPAFEPLPRMTWAQKARQLAEEAAARQVDLDDIDTDDESDYYNELARMQAELDDSDDDSDSDDNEYRREPDWIGPEGIGYNDDDSDDDSDADSDYYRELARLHEYWMIEEDVGDVPDEPYGDDIP